MKSEAEIVRQFNTAQNHANVLGLSLKLLELNSFQLSIIPPGATNTGQLQLVMVDNKLDKIIGYIAGYAMAKNGKPL
jgi:hypothetical protein